jgi:hypothetical protein
MMIYGFRAESTWMCCKLVNTSENGPMGYAESPEDGHACRMQD